MTATLDFETFSAAGYRWDAERQRWTSPPGFAPTNRGLEVVGVDNYTAHHTFRPLSLTFDLHDGRGVERATFPDSFARYPCPPRLAAHVLAGGLVEAWNAGFDLYYVWQWCVRNWGWPDSPLEQQRCSMARSRAASYPGGLDNAAVVLGAKPKDPAGKPLIRKLTVPRNPTKGNGALRLTPETAPEDFEAFYRYNEGDVVSETEVGGLLPPLSPYELSVWMLDQRINRRGMGIDRASVENCIAIVEQATERANAELRTLTGGAVESFTEVAAMLRWFAWRGVSFHELDEETVTGALARTDLPADVLRVLRIRQQLSFGSVRKLYAMREQTGRDGRLREQYTYHGAHTSLWNGRGVQPANLPRPMHDAFEKPAEVEHALAVIARRSLDALEAEYGPGSEFAARTGRACDPLEVIASCLRSLIVAAPGHRLISADFTAIQAVVTAAIAGEDWVLDVFRTHGKIYEAMASRLTGTPVETYAEYKRTTGKHHADRQLGKVAQLSAFFGAWVGGWKRFGADKIIGDDEAIKAAILKTRAAIPAIVELWGGQTRDRFDRQWERPELYGLEGAAVAALQNVGQAYDYRGIVYQSDGATLYCRTLDGGLMRYHNARLRPSTRSWARSWELEILYEGWSPGGAKGPPGWQTMSLYGGVLTQNVVSRISRMVQSDAMLRLEAAGYPVVMHTHDEQVAELADGAGSREEYERIVNVLPEWARTPDGRPWPIRAPDPWEAPRYGKW